MRRCRRLTLVLCLAAVAPLVEPGRANTQSPAPAPMPSPRAVSPSSAAAASPAANASPAPTAARVLEGTVVGPDAKPVAGALVAVQPAAGFSFGEPTATTRTDAIGHFRVPVKTASLYLVRVEALGLAARTLARVRPGDPLRIALDKGGFIEGIVRDGTTAAPAAGITVEARLEAARGMGIVWERGAGVVRTKTDAQGRFRLEGLAPGVHTLAAHAPGLAAQRRGVVVGKRTELFLLPGGGLDGLVRGPDGGAVAGAAVAIEGATLLGSRSTDVEVTDGRGRYEFPGVDPGLYRVIARHPDFAPSWTTVTVERGGDASADLTLAAPAAIVGRLVGAADRPVSGRVTIAEADGAPPPFSIAPRLAAEAGADGRFRIESVPPGSFVLSVAAPGYGAKRAEVVVGTRQRVAELGDLTLESGLVIRGHVREPGGAPIAEARLSAFRDRAMGEDRGDGRSTADGSFAIGGLRAGTYRVAVFAPGHGTTDREVEAGTDAVDFVLDTAGSLAGVVIDDRGQPVETFRVQARMPPPNPAAGGGRIMTGPPRFESISSPDGRFVVDDVSPGAYVVEISAPERATTTVSNVKVSAGAATDLGRVTLAAGGIVRGTVVDAAGAAVPAAVVTVQGIGRSFAFGPTALPEAVTETGGTFELRGVASGPIQLAARHPSFAEGRASAEVDPAKDPPEVRLVLLQGGRIEGRARRRDGTPVAGAVNVFSRRSGSPFAPNSMTPISPDGTFVVEHVPAGTVNVVLMEGAGGQLTSSKEREVELLEGQTASIEFVARDILVTGRVTRAGAAAPNLRLRVFGDQFNAMITSGAAAAPPAPGPQRMTAVTRDDGSYEMLVDEPGKGTIRIEALDGAVNYPSQRVEFPDADAYAFDIALPAASIAGVVVERETDQPIAKAGVSAISVRPDPNARFGMPSMSTGMTGADGRFRLDVEPGEYRLSARAEGFSGETINLTVAESGASDLRVALTRGMSIRGRVVDARGQGVGGLRVGAATSDVAAPGWGGATMSMADGTFEIAGLAAGEFNLVAQSELGFFALRPSVPAGTSDVTLPLRRGGRVLVTVLGPDSTPVRGAFASVRRVSGTVAWGIGAMVQTDAHGNTELNVPVGAVEIRANREGGLEGVATVAVSEGATVPVEVTLAPRKETPPPR